MERVPSELADVIVLDTAGAPHRLGDAWAEHAAVVAFIRHFG